MATKSSGPRFPEFLGNADSPEAVRQQLIEEPLAAAKREAMSTGLELLAFMGAIPAALIASQERELRRMAGRGNKDKAVARMRATINHAKQMQTMAEAGRARILRIAEIAGGGEAPSFHGFVSDMSLKPLPGMTVRISEARAAKDAAPSDTTHEDGSFRIPLDSRRTRPDTGMDQPSSDTIHATDGGDTTRREAVVDTGLSVEILDARGNVVYQDPSSLTLSGGSIYREYVLPQPQGARAA